ncbi:hypothetical protein [Nocardia sp. NPDC060259]|uniref:hypothetical protein n=1 Tax=Nocardia sp. NPDC060259 TaxID=3347088 RepID=UPI003656E8A2
MTTQNTILSASTTAAAQALELIPRNDRWWAFERNLCDMFAQNHPWAEADGHLHDPRLRLRVAHARVLREEDIAGQYLSAEQPSDCAPGEAECWLVPLRLQSWEAKNWDTEHLWRYHEKHSGSNGQAFQFPPERLAFPMLVHPKERQGQPADTSDFGLMETQRTIINQITVVRGTAEEAIAHQLTINDWEQPEEPAQAAMVDFSEAYPALLCLLGGEGAFRRASESEGRLRLWRLLYLMAGSTDVDDINDFVARIRCMTWRDWSDDIWYMHLAVEDPAQRTAWVLDGQDFD